MLDAACDKATIEHDIHLTENRSKGNEYVITREVESALKELVSNKRSRIVEEAMSNALCKMFNKEQSGFQSVVYSFVGQVMLDLLRKGVIEETLDARKSTFFKPYEPSGCFFKRRVASASFVTPILAFSRRKSAKAMENKKFSTAVAPKELVDTMLKVKDDRESELSRFDTGDEEHPVRSRQEADQNMAVESQGEKE